MARTAREMMTEDCKCVGENETIVDAAHKLAALNVGALPICGEDDRLKGMLTDRDIVVKVLAQGKDPGSTRAGELGEGTPTWVSTDASEDEVLQSMRDHEIRRLPVIDEDKRLVGIIAQADVATNLSEKRTGEVVEAISAAAPNN
ncbi:MAG: CBS domain-containing protein [Solirubrobacterales bacterium]